MIVLDLNDRRWAAFVEGHSNATPFHHPSWGELLARCYRFRAFALAWTDAMGRITGGLPIIEVRSPVGGRRWVSLPFTDACAPLTDMSSATTRLVEELDDARRQAGVSRLEVRGDLRGPGASTSPTAVIHTLPLDGGGDTIYRTSLRPSVRKWIAAAERGGVVVRREGSRIALTRSFYNLHLQTRRRLGVPVQPRRYFDLLWSEMIAPGLGFLLLAYVNDAPVAGAVFLSWNGTVIYKYGASDPTYWKLHPNHLLMWTGLRWGCDNGAHTFDFGRSDFASEGLRQFKRSWGARESTLVYTAMGGQAAARPSDGRFHAMARAVVCRSPLWACRGLGELLYRYVA
jgi:CelD/BcsL family acetyltransferase involved in cellulose biosynthesis